MSTTDITYAEAIAGFRALAAEIGPDADWMAKLNDQMPIWSFSLAATIWPSGILDRDRSSFNVKADTFRVLLAAARAEWEERRDSARAERIAKMASEIIRITYERGDCDDAALRQAGFTDREIADLGTAACDRANLMSAFAPFVINRGAKSNGAPSLEAAE